MAASLAVELPWTRCQQWWGADQFCFSRGVRSDNFTSNTYFDIEEKILYFNGTRVCSNNSPSSFNISYNNSINMDCVNVTLQTATTQYWE